MAGTDWKMLEILLDICPARVRKEGLSGGEIVLLPGEARLAETAPGAEAILLPGFSSPFRAEAFPAGSFPLLVLRGADGTAVLEFLPDSQAASPGELSPAALRAHYDARFRTLLRSRLPASWRVERLASGPDARMRFGGCFARLVFRRPGGFSAGMAMYPFQSPERSASFLTAAIAWFHHCRETRRRYDDTLVLLCPEEVLPHLPGRLRLLNRSMLRPLVWAYGRGEHDLRPAGEEAAEEGPPPGFVFAPCRPPFGNAVLEELLVRHAPHLEKETSPHGYDLASCRGLSVVRVFGPGEADVFIGYRRPWIPYRDFPPARLAEWLASVAARRAVPPPLPGHEAYRLFPERWLEWAVLRDIRQVDPALRPATVCRQVPTWRGGHRSLVDIFALGENGRPVVLEVKAERDEACLFQALDYWDRVRLAVERDADAFGAYLPGVKVGKGPPLACLVVPLFAVHPRVHLVAAYLSRHVPVVLVEGNLGWRGGWRTVRRTVPGF